MFDRLDLYQENTDTGRYYHTPDKKKYPSVTTVLSSVQDKTHLNEWANRIGKENADKIKTQAASRGTKLHLLCEHYLLNYENYFVGVDIATVDLFKTIQPHLDKNVTEIYGIEMPLYSDFLRTAGKCDLFCKVNDQYTVVDFKTSTRPKKEEWIKNYFLQLTTYALMIEERYNISVPNIEVIIACEDSPYQIFTKKVSEYKEEVIEIFRNYSES